MKKQRIFGRAVSAIANTAAIALFLIVIVGSDTAYAQDPSMEMYRIRCQIDDGTDPVTGGVVPKVQIQGKARAELLDGLEVRFTVQNLSNPAAPIPAQVLTLFDLGSASADWDTFPDPANPVTTIDGSFVASDEEIMVSATVVSTDQTVSGTAQCADKTSSQFKQDTKGRCKLKDELRQKCKIGDVLSNDEIFDGTNYPPPP